MPKKSKLATCLEVKMPCGETFYLSAPLTMVYRSASPIDLAKGWGDDAVLIRLAKDDLCAIRARDDAKEDTYVLCKPFEWMRWVEVTIEGKPETEPKTATDKFKHEE